MPLVTSKELLLDAQKQHYAIGAFNVENMEMIQAVVAAAEAQRSPVIIQTTSSTLKYASPELFYANVAAAAAASVPVVLHLDHGSGYDIALRCFRAGYTSIMIDGSQKPFAENIALTRAVVQACQAGKVPVEAELGKVGGKEDELVSQGGSYTEPGEAAEFVARTGVDSLAVAIGTAHGVYKGTPRLDLNRLSQLREAVSVPLVLHGTSGVPEETVRECIRRGICKVNYATDLRMAFTQGIREAFARNPQVFDPKEYGAAARDRVRAYVEARIALCGSSGKG